MKNTKLLLALLMILFSAGLVRGTENLNMYLDYNRFLDKNDDTILLLDYQVPYRSLVFLAQNKGYFAQLDVAVKLFWADSLVAEQSVTDNIGISSKADAGNNSKSYLNRLSFNLTKAEYTVQFNATDPNSSRNFTWQFKVEKLPENTLLSDIEINSEVRPDSLQFLQKFHRKNTLYRSEPSVLINKNQTDFVYLYLESYHDFSDVNDSVLLNLSLEKDSVIVMDEYMDYIPTSISESLSLKIPLEDLKPGGYNGLIILQDGDKEAERSFEFVLFEEKEERFYLFSNPEEEYELMRYFLGNRMPTDWKSLNLEKKQRYGTQFWRNMAAATKRSIPEALALVQQRIDYANKHFGHMKQGWSSDMGRIYIRNGAADDIQRDTSSDESRFVRKDYQIWKYASGNKPVYLFIDIQMNGNYKLIYVDNDDLEASNPDWMRFVGSDFDTSKLDN